MTLIIGGTGTISGIQVGGLQPGSVNTASLAASSVTQTKIADGVTSAGPAFSAYVGVNQSITGGASTKVQFNTKQFDTATCYDTTLYRFTPNIAGYYHFLSTIDMGAPNNRYTATLYKNGSAFLSGVNIVGNGTNSQGCMFSGIAYANGSTDYFEIYVQGNNSATLGGGTGPIYSYFQAFMMRAA